MSRPTYSVVLPVFNESGNLNELYSRLTATLRGLGEPYELIFVDDGSSDDSVHKILALRDQDKAVKLVRLSRNFGHQLALSAGLAITKGHAVIAMDSDLQDLPEDIPKLVGKWKDGYEVVYAIRATRKENPVKQACYRTFYRILAWYSDISIPLDAGDFSLMDRKVVDLINRLPERTRYVRGLRAWLGFKQIGLSVDRDARFAGSPKYSLAKLINLAASGFLSFSIAPLRLATTLGLFVSLMSFIGIVVVFYVRLFTTLSLPGFAAVATILFFLGGIQLLTIGVLGEYIGRIFDEVKGRPLYIISEVVGAEADDGRPAV